VTVEWRSGPYLEVWEEQFVQVYRDTEQEPKLPRIRQYSHTNLKDPFCKIFDGTTFIARSRRTRVVDTLINNRIKDMFDLFELNNTQQRQFKS
jgi:hypothetical protein